MWKCRPSNRSASRRGLRAWRKVTARRDERLLEINRDRLGHDFYTDIVTFPLTDCETVLSSEFCISIDRIRENATTFGRSYESELHRVIIHGVLHLIGFDDLTDEEEKEMREKEEDALEMMFSKKNIN